ncbi:meiosis 1 arrest protein-like [Octopus bimaculoides]|uniref:meiosis 1 arrest protein-like n=1 Tax=Octopus bimaculoides TaxID=37653 RepID=UPI00071DC63A|nr:meiosis 1 arrest protein-like [Octopus bimaculoides]XP_014786354.1 meiosis 1 arrest protein-like [Octopus bimaculoides]|eukprot:XP_014786353.1 PREDICTED: meiosis 1 arrest protein-like [Octopus bimaculoides]
MKRENFKMQSSNCKQPNSSKGNTLSSLVFRQHPATAMIIDLASGIPKDTVHTISNSLENIFSLICTMSGPCKIPFFSVATLSGFFEILLPMISVRGNFLRIQYCLNELKQMAELGCKEHLEDRERTLSQAFIEIARQFQQFKNASLQLQILFLTNKHKEKLTLVEKSVEKALDTVNVEYLKHVQVVGLNNTIETWTGETLNDSNPLSHSDNSQSSSMDASVIETISIESDPLSLHSYFSILLKDGATDYEHLHLILPPHIDDIPMVIKCDVLTSIINPIHIPFREHYLLCMDNTSGKPLLSPGSNLSRTTHPLIIVCIKQILPSSALCESLIFGMPYILEPTSSWKIDWDELESNRANFQALCHILLEKEHVLIGQLGQETISSVPPQNNLLHDSFLKTKHPLGCFVLLPSQSGKMLIKSLACKELMVAQGQSLQAEMPSHSNLQMIESSISQLEFLETYNPLFVSSGLYTALINFVSKQSQPKQQKQSAKASITEETKAKQRSLFHPSKEISFSKKRSSKYKNQYKEVNSWDFDFTDACDFIKFSK